MTHQAKIIVAFLSAMLLAACSIPVSVRKGEPFALDRPVLVTMKSGAEYPARAVSTDNDTLVIDRENREEKRVSVDAVHRVIVLDREGGFLRGAGNGFWIGMGSGLLIGLIADGSCEGIGCGYISAAAVLPIVGAIVGAPVGAVVGVAQGHGARYRFDTPHASSRAVTGAAGPGDTTRSSAYTPPTGAAAFHEDARYPSHAERRRRAEAQRALRESPEDVTDTVIQSPAAQVVGGKSVAASGVTGSGRSSSRISRSYQAAPPHVLRFGVEAGTAGLSHVVNAGKQSANFGTFEARYYAVSVMRYRESGWQGGFRLSGALNQAADDRLREVALIGDLTRPLGSRGAFVRLGAGLSDYALVDDMRTSSSIGFVGVLSLGQTLFATEKLDARIMLELAGAVYDNSAKSGTVKVMMGVGLK